MPNETAVLDHALFDHGLSDEGRIQYAPHFSPITPKPVLDPDTRA